MTTDLPLTPDEVESFMVRAFHALRHAFPREVADECRALMWQQLGLSPDRPDEWAQPVVRLGSQKGSPFHDAAHTPRLEAAWDQLVGAGRCMPKMAWVAPRRCAFQWRAIPVMTAGT